MRSVFGNMWSVQVLSCLALLTLALYVATKEEPLLVHNFMKAFKPSISIKNICFGKLGCFKMKWPEITRSRPVPGPIPPHLMDAEMWYYSREYMDQKFNVRVHPIIELNNTPFNNCKPTFFITHGFEHSALEEWVDKMRRTILNVTDANVFIGQWGGGSKVTSYFQAVGNTRGAARQFSNVFQYLVDQRGLNVSNLHLIGHSLGAQICGLIGKSISGVFQITALDPAQPLYDVAANSVRLSKSDASFVVCIHSDARIFLPDLGFGFMNECGHTDFYISGGHGQPPCQFPRVLYTPKITNIFDFAKPPHQIVVEALLCPHQAAVDVYTEAMGARHCIFWGHAVSMGNLIRGTSNINTAGFFSQFLAGSEKKCTTETCSPLGLFTYYWPARGTFVVITRGSEPFCIYEDAIIDIRTQLEFITTMQKFIIDTVTDSDSGKKNSTAQNHALISGLAGKYNSGQNDDKKKKKG